MRRAIGDEWPALSHYFGLHPWDVERLTFREIDIYRDALADIVKRNQQLERSAAARPRRRR